MIDYKKEIRERRVIASISGGRDSAAMSLYLAELGIEHERVFADTGWEHPKTIDYLFGPLQAKLGPISVVRGEEDFLQLVDRKGLFPSRMMRFCTTELKVFPIRKFIQEQSRDGDVVNAIGIRREESKRRSKMHEWEWSESFDCDLWRPIIEWSAHDVAAIHVRHDLPMNPLYGMGMKRVGCWPCIHENKRGIAIVAKTDPDRIELIATKERDLSARDAARARDLKRPFVERSMFSYGGGGRKHVPLPIYDAVTWANSKRGEWQPAGHDGCARHGVCEGNEGNDE